MKKTALLFVALSAAAMAQAQNQEWFFRAGLGYALPMAGQSLSAGDGLPYNGSLTNGTDYSIKNASFSAGTSLHVGLGYMFNRNIGVQVDAQVGVAAKTYTLDDNNVAVTYGSGSSAATIASDVQVTHQANTPVNIIPSLVMRLPSDPWTVYTRVGVVLPVSNDITREVTIRNRPGTGASTVQTESWKLSSTFSPGLTAALGVQYAINEHVSIWGEISGISMSMYIKQADLEQFTANGHSYSLSQLGGTQHYTYSQNAKLDSVYNNIQPAYTLPFSNVSFNVGVRYAIPRVKHVNTESEGPRLRKGSVI
jgi:opacity protein-like surface antigen